MPLLPEHEKYHKMGPKDVSFKEETPIMALQVVKNTANTGEQLALEVPVYKSDSREEMMTRINMAYSILQDRMEDENKAIMHLNERAQKRQAFAESMRNNKKKANSRFKQIQKKLRKGEISEEQFNSEAEKLDEELKAAQAQLLESLGLTGEDVKDVELPPEDKE